MQCSADRCVGRVFVDVVCVFVVLYIVLCLDHFGRTGLLARIVFVVCVGGLCGKLVRAHGGCLGIESR